MCDPFNGRAELSGEVVRVEEGNILIRVKEGWSQIYLQLQEAKKNMACRFKRFGHVSRRNGDAIGRDFQLAKLHY